MSPREIHDEPEWTYTEGLRDLALFLLRRLPIAAAIWLAAAYVAYVPLSHLPRSHLLTAIFTIPLGMIVGYPLGKGIHEKTQLIGWVPMLAATALAAVVTFGGNALVDTVRPFGEDFTRALVATCGAIGAGATIARFTLVES